MSDEFSFKILHTAPILQRDTKYKDNVLLQLEFVSFYRKLNDSTHDQRIEYVTKLKKNKLLQ